MARLPRVRPRTHPTQRREEPYGFDSQLEASFVYQAERHAQRYFWGMLGGWAIAGVFGLCLAWMSMQTTVALHVVEVEAGTGVVRQIKAAEVAYDPPVAVAMAEVRHFIVATRGLTLDPVWVHQEWEWAFAVVTQRGRQHLAAYGQERDLRKDIGKKGIQIKFTRVLQATPTSYDVSWQETITQEDGTETVEFWAGLFTLVQHQPTNETDLLVTPFGLWVESWDWRKL